MLFRSKKFQKPTKFLAMIRNALNMIKHVKRSNLEHSVEVANNFLATSVTSLAMVEIFSLNFSAAVVDHAKVKISRPKFLSLSEMRSLVKK